MPESRPLGAIGVLSAENYGERRAAIRATWLSSAPAEFVVRFVVAVNTLRGTYSECAAEQQQHHDMVLLPSNVTSREWSPLITTFRWFEYATTHHDTRGAEYIAKIDDDVYIHLPELALHLRLVRGREHVYYGVLYWGIYKPLHYAVVTTGRSRRAASTNAKASCPFHTCAGPFPFTTGSCQLLSGSLAKAVINATAVRKSVADAERIACDPAHIARKKHIAYEDVWLGYAVRNLLPDRTAITVVGFDAESYYFDKKVGDGWQLRNTTFLMHNTRKTSGRLEAAHLAMRLHCMSNASLECGRPQMFAYSRNQTAGKGELAPVHQAGLGPSAVYTLCMVRPSRSACPGNRKRDIISQ